MDDDNWEPLGSAVERVLHKIAGPYTAPPRVELRPNVGRFLPPHEVRPLLGVWLQISVMNEDPKYKQCREAWDFMIDLWEMWGDRDGRRP